MDRREIVLVLRLLVSADGGLVYGDIVDVRRQGSSRFTKWGRLEATMWNVLRAALERKGEPAPDHSTRSPH